MTVVIKARWSVAMKKLIGIVIVATSIGAPAFAQSFDPDNGTGNLVTGNFVAATSVHARAVPRRPGERAYALSPRRTINSNAGQFNDTPAGGSTGYNEMLRNW
jgi:hypothetical protein